MQPVPSRYSLGSHSHDWLVQSLASLNGKRFATLKELPAVGGNSCLPCAMSDKHAHVHVTIAGVELSGGVVTLGIG